MPLERGKLIRDPWTKAFLALFGGLFLISLLAVPVVTMITAERHDPGSQIVLRMTFPRRSTMFLPSYLAAKDHPGEGREVRLRAGKWAGTMALVVVLGVFDYFVICGLLRRRAAIRAAEAGPAAAGDDSKPEGPGLDLFR